MMPQRPPRPCPLPRPQLFCGRGPTPAATGPSSPPFGTEPSTLAQTPHHLSLSPSASPPLTPPPPSVPDTTLTPSPTPSVRTADQVYRPPPHPAPEDAHQLSTGDPTDPALLEKRPVRGLGHSYRPQQDPPTLPPSLPAFPPPDLPFSPLTWALWHPLSSGSSFLLANPFPQGLPFPRLAHFLEASSSFGFFFRLILDCAPPSGYRYLVEGFVLLPRACHFLRVFLCACFLSCKMGILTVPICWVREGRARASARACLVAGAQTHWHSGPICCPWRGEGGAPGEEAGPA